MSPVTAGTAAGAAAVTVGRGVLSAAAGGLSFMAELARAAGGAVTDEAKDKSAAASEAFDNLVSDLQRRIKRFLAAEGITLSKPVELASDGAGGIAVAAPHPERAAIEAALASDLLMERDFQQLADQSVAGRAGFSLAIEPGF